jgi:hypothetical protein
MRVCPIIGSRKQDASTLRNYQLREENVRADGMVFACVPMDLTLSARP